jgi:methyltransferase (TIGR00027 family)
MTQRRASRTAVLVCQGRAAAHGRIAPGRFADPTAMPLLHDDEREPVHQVRAGQAPPDWADRLPYEMVRACADMMAPRTVAIDDAVRAGPLAQVVILGAGLDGRAWRMPELASAAVFEVDHPASQRDKRDRAAALPGPAPRFVAVDFGRDDLTAALDRAGHRADLPTTWIWEGVVPYLTRAEVAATVAAVARRSPSGSRLVVNYQAPSLRTDIGRLLMRVMAVTAPRARPWRREPWRSTWTPTSMQDLLDRHGFAVRRDDDLRAVAGALGVTPGQRGSLSTGRVAVADRP